MTQLARRASLLVVLLLLTVGTASADCAWVLWLVWGGSFQKTTDGGLYTPPDRFDAVSARR